MLPLYPSSFRASAALLMLALLLAGCAAREPRPASSRRAAATAPRLTPFAPQPSAAPVPKPTVSPPALAVDDATRLQIFLDREGFGPGKLDGKSGEFTRKAVARYARAHGKTLPAPGPELLKALPAARDVDPVYIDYTFTADDAALIGAIPDDRAAQGKLKSLPYTSPLELVAERFHSERDFLRRLNPGRNLDALRAGDRLRVPNIDSPLYVARLPQHGKFLPARPEFQPRVVKVDTQEKMLDVIEDGQLLASFPITPGSTTLPAPVGTWKLVNSASMPYFRYDEMMLNHGVRSENFVQLPPGPNSPVGVMWMGLNKSGIGLHGTNNPETIGRAASHGCIRLANWDAVKLSTMLTPGVTVKID
jgi:lipoprotein-anchoring transpeptidase ErfK/SrfK